MKLGPVTKIDKKNKTTSKKIDDDIMSENCNVIAIFPVYSLLPPTHLKISKQKNLKTNP